MSGACYKMVGENIAKGLSPKTIQRLSISGRLLSRTGAAVGVGFLVYELIQKSIAHIVDQIRPIESAYSARIYYCSREIQKTLGSNAAWAAISTATLGFVKKPVA